MFFTLYKSNACLLKTKDKEVAQSATIQTKFHCEDVDISSNLVNKVGIFILFSETLFFFLLKIMIICFEERIFNDDL